MAARLPSCQLPWLRITLKKKKKKFTQSIISLRMYLPTYDATCSNRVSHHHHLQPASVPLRPTRLPMGPLHDACSRAQVRNIAQCNGTAKVEGPSPSRYSSLAPSCLRLISSLHTWSVIHEQVQTPSSGQPRSRWCTRPYLSGD